MQCSDYHGMELGWSLEDQGMEKEFLAQLGGVKVRKTEVIEANSDE